MMKPVNNFIANLREDIKYRLKYGFWPKCGHLSLSGYEILMDAILEYKLYKMEGDFVEIGAFAGAGTYKLAKLLQRFRPGKKIYAIDIFNPAIDNTENAEGKKMSDMYRSILKENIQYQIYTRTIRECDNVITISGDSKKIVLGCDKIAFGYIDGNHSPDYVRSDFYLIWNRLEPKGMVALDDYGYDLPHVTETIDKLIDEQKQNIARYWKQGAKTIFIQKKA